jgi:hypothetical protein
MNELNDLEQAVLDKLLAGSEPVLQVLREQVKQARVASRKFTGAGFFCNLEVPVGVRSLTTNRNFHFGDVNAHIDGLEHGAGFVLRVRAGVLTTLEGYSYDEPWPDQVKNFSLEYQSDPRSLKLPSTVGE